MQRALSTALLAVTFDGKPYGIILGVFGLLDKVIVAKCSSLLLGILPSWLDDDILEFEEKVKGLSNSVTADVKLIRQETNRFVKEILVVIDDSVKVLEQVEGHMTDAKVIMHKLEQLLGPAAVLLEEVLARVGVAFDELGTDIKFARSEMSSLDSQLTEELDHGFDKMHAMAKKLLESLESIRPAKIIQKLEDCAEECLYGGLISKMSESRLKGQAQLTP